MPYTSVLNCETNLDMKEELQNIDLSMFEFLTDASMNTVVVIDEVGIIHAVSRSVTQDFGYNQDELIGKNVSCLMPSSYAKSHDGYLKKYHETRQRNIIGTGREVTGQRKDGTTFPMHLNVSEFQFHNRSAFVGICYDISEKRRLSEKMFKLAAYDSLTDCFNRHHLIKTLDATLKDSANANRQVGVLFIDLDGFKQINDHYSHTIGDLLLKKVAKRLRDSLRNNDCLGRIGGDEFIAIIIASDHASIQKTAERLLKTLLEPFEIKGMPLKVSASIGISIYPHHGDSSEVLVSAADIAMYQAKSYDEPRICLFNQDMRKKSEYIFQISTRLRDALQNERFELHYQPQFNLKTGELSGLEALIRWRDIDNTLIPPGDFLPIAQKYGLIPEITNWVLRQACHDNALLIELAIANVPISVNISATSFYNHDFVQTVISTCEKYKLPPNKLEIELTEDIAIHNFELVTKHTHALRAAGFLLAMDDFGTGYSSLSRLKNLKFNKLKIDGAFVRELSDSIPDQAIFHAILEIAHSLNMKVVAEGIETEHQASWLCEKGCQYGQGFWLARPMPLEALQAYLSRNSHCPAQENGSSKTFNELAQACHEL